MSRQGTAVDSHVPIKITALTESKQTQLTLIRFLTGVYTQMLSKCRAVGKRFFAESTSGKIENGNQQLDII